MLIMLNPTHDETSPSPYGPMVPIVFTDTTDTTDIATIVFSFLISQFVLHFLFHLPYFVETAK